MKLKQLANCQASKEADFWLHEQNAYLCSKLLQCNGEPREEKGVPVLHTFLLIVNEVGERLRIYLKQTTIPL